MSPIGDKIKTESQAREFAKVEPARRVEVLPPEPLFPAILFRVEDAV